MRTLTILLLLCGTAFALSGGYAPCYHDGDNLHCIEDQYVPLWETVTPPEGFEPPPKPEPVPEPPQWKPTKENADWNCKDCHEKDMREKWGPKLHREHKEEVKDCTKCHI